MAAAGAPGRNQSSTPGGRTPMLGMASGPMPTSSGRAQACEWARSSDATCTAPDPAGGTPSPLKVNAAADPSPPVATASTRKRRRAAIWAW